MVKRLSRNQREDAGQNLENPYCKAEKSSKPSTENAQ
jgi:hypothetical protein